MWDWQDVQSFERWNSPDLQDALEAEGLGDGLPVVVPTRERVEEVLRRNRLQGEERIVHVLPSRREATATALAVQLVMAGGRPEHFPVLQAALEALVDPALNGLGVLTTTGSACCAIMVSGPAAAQLGFNGGGNALGPGNRANAAVGRAFSLTVRQIGKALYGSGDMATMGQPGKYTFCFSENGAESPWAPFHTLSGPGRGLDPEDNAVTVFGTPGTMEFVDTQTGDAEELLPVLGGLLASPFQLFLGEDLLVGGGYPLVLMSPEWAQGFSAAGWTRERVQACLFEHARCSIDRLTPSARAIVRQRRREDGEYTEPALRPARQASDVLVAVVGGVGVKQTVVPSWHGGSQPVTRRFDPV